MAIVRHCLRASPRYPKRVLVKLGNSLCFTVDVSSQGMCVATARGLAPGAAVEGVISAGGGVFRFSGRVVWVRAGDAPGSASSLVGIEFVKVPYELRRRVLEVAPAA